MENFLEELELSELFPGKTHYKHKEDGFIYSDHLGGPNFWIKHGNNFRARPNDIYIASYPRTGTTWTAELVYLLATDLNYEAAKSLPSRERYPYLNFVETPIEAYDIPSPRCIRTHLPYAHLPKTIIERKCKIVYTLRNPKDALVSYFNFSLMNKHINYVGDFDTLFDMFLNGRLTCGPFEKHTLQYWEHRNDDNVFMISFEERKKDFPSCIKKLAQFLGKSITEQQVEELAQHCSFSAMKSNPNVNLEDAALFDREKGDFIRKGEVGDWKNYFSEEQSLKFDDYMKKHFEKSGLKYSYEI